MPTDETKPAVQVTREHREAALRALGCGPYEELASVAIAISEAEQRERVWWEARIRELIGSAEEERYGGGPVVGAGALERLLERAKEDRHG